MLIVALLTNKHEIFTTPVSYILWRYKTGTFIHRTEDVKISQLPTARAKKFGPFGPKMSGYVDTTLVCKMTTGATKTPEFVQEILWSVEVCPHLFTAFKERSISVLTKDYNE